MKVGIVGLGVISRFYVEALERMDHIELTAVADLDESVLAPFRDRVKCFTSHEELLRGADVDAVIVNVPNHVHATVCRDALLAGRAVCVEKPLATTVEDGRALVELARERGLPLFTAFHRRYNSNVLALKNALPEGVPIESVTVRYFERIEEHVGRDDWYLDPARCGGGCVADNGPNAFDLVHLFAGPAEVTDAVVVRDDRGVDRHAVIELAAGDGVRARVELDWSYPDGERKDVTIRLADGSVATADMLAGYPAFKSSLAHEYVGVLEEFHDVVRGSRTTWPDGLAALELVRQAYDKERPGAARRAHAGPVFRSPDAGEDAAKHTVEGGMVKILAHRREDRGMVLEPFASRCVRAGEIHELVTTDQTGTAPGTRVDRVAFVGFAEIDQAGVIDRGDEVWIGGSPVGRVLGFDACHFPNHYNVLISTPEPRTGPELGLAPGMRVRFVPAHET